MNRKRLRDHLTKRIDALHALAIAQGDLSASHAQVDTSRIVLAIEAQIGSFTDRIVTKNRSLRAAILDRPETANNWPLDRYDREKLTEEEERHLRLLHLVEHRNGQDPTEWPANLAPNDLAEALEETKSPEALLLAQRLRDGSIWPSSDPSDNQRRILFSPALSASAQDRNVSITNDAAKPDRTGSTHEDIKAAATTWPLRACACIVSVAKQVRGGIASFRATPIPSTSHARAALCAISYGDSPEWSGKIIKPSQATMLELVWKHEKREPVQLSLGFTYLLDRAILVGVLNKLKEDGLRDYLVLHRMAAEQGRTGKLKWTWKEHRERTAYERRIRNGDLKEDEAIEAVTERLWNLHHATLQEYVEASGKKVWRRIGPHGLIDIPAGYGTDNTLELAPIVLNPEIYKGAAKGTKGQHFALLPDEAFALSGPRFRLAVLLTLDMRYARDETEGVIGRRADKLCEYLDTRGSTTKGRAALTGKRWNEIDRAIQNALNELAGARVIGSWDREGDTLGPATIYRIEPTVEWRDQVIHRLTPELPPCRIDIPRNGAELRTWRDSRGLSQAEAAKQLGVGIATIKRAEQPQALALPLGDAIARALLKHAASKT